MNGLRAGMSAAPLMAAARVAAGVTSLTCHNPTSDPMADGSLTRVSTTGKLHMARHSIHDDRGERATNRCSLNGCLNIEPRLQGMRVFSIQFWQKCVREAQ